MIMTPDQVTKALDNYEATLRSLGAAPIEVPHDQIPTHSSQALNHALSMIEPMRGFIKDGRWEKLWRWLGFLQSILWQHARFTLETLKNDNR